LGADFTGSPPARCGRTASSVSPTSARWERIAVIASEPWVRHAVDVFGYRIPGEVKVFDLEDEADAAAWVTA
jgi:hypothetical protein